MHAIVNTPVHVLFTEAQADCLFFATPPPFTIDDCPWVVANVSLGGVFYDHICRNGGELVGVRYWLDGDRMTFQKHEVFRRFMNDDRFVFDDAASAVDILFDRADVKPFKAGALQIVTVQDFGGDSVVKFGNLYGIVFELQ